MIALSDITRQPQASATVQAGLGHAAQRSLTASLRLILVTLDRGLKTKKCYPMPTRGYPGPAPSSRGKRLIAVLMTAGDVRVRYGTQTRDPQFHNAPLEIPNVIPRNGLGKQKSSALRQTYTAGLGAAPTAEDVADAMDWL